MTTSKTVNMTWSPPALEHQNGLIHTYLVNVTELKTGVLKSYSTNNNWLFVTGLHPHYNYLFVFAAVTVGIGPTGSNTIITTEEDGTNVYAHYKQAIKFWFLQHLLLLL